MVIKRITAVRRGKESISKKKIPPSFQGCATCTCNENEPIGTNCAPMKCDLNCPYGFERDPSGCEICSCNRCPPYTCRMFCAYGFKKNSEGCDICECDWSRISEKIQCSEVRTQHRRTMMIVILFILEGSLSRLSCM